MRLYDGKITKWYTYSKNQYHGLKILKNDEIILMEDNQELKKDFSREDIKKITEGRLDVTQYF